MNQAKSGNEIVHLHTVSAGELQTLFEKGKRDQLSCIICHKPVKLFIGIHETPYFYHSDPSQGTLWNANFRIHKWRKALGIYGTEWLGFQHHGPLLKQKTITEPFLKSRPITGNPKYSDKPYDMAQSEEPYFQELSSSGVVLDAEQLKAVMTIDGPILVLSGAGSGKTRVLTVRTAYMLTVKKIDPKSIMLVTFTAKSAKEISSVCSVIPIWRPSLVSQIV